jgi:hypothetical protein
VQLHPQLPLAIGTVILGHLDDVFEEHARTGRIAQLNVAGFLVAVGAAGFEARQRGVEVHTRLDHPLPRPLRTANIVRLPELGERLVNGG